MINFIIYEDEKKYREKYINVILRLIGNTKNAYKIIEIDHYDKIEEKKLQEITGKKIYILDIEVPGKSGLDLARSIRSNGDWESPMIVATTHEYLKDTTFTSKMLMLDFISKFYNCEENLKKSLKLSIDIVSTHQSLNFQSSGELYQIPYNDILYIEKNVEDAYSTIITKSKDIKIKETIGELEKKLSVDNRFFRTHRSCIVNTDNIISIELKTNTIYFENKETTLLSRDKKSDLKNIMNVGR